LNEPLTHPPTAKTTKMISAAIAATSNPYSTADAPSSESAGELPWPRRAAITMSGRALCALRGAGGARR
jgi:hypothetical protein